MHYTKQVIKIADNFEKIAQQQTQSAKPKSPSSQPISNDQKYSSPNAIANAASDPIGSVVLSASLAEAAKLKKLDID